MSRSFWKGFAAMYLAAALVFGLCSYRIMPAINWMGAAYYGAVWPAWPVGVALDVNFPPIPTWAVTIPEDRP